MSSLSEIHPGPCTRPPAALYCKVLVILAGLGAPAAAGRASESGRYPAPPTDRPPRPTLPTGTHAPRDPRPVEDLPQRHQSVKPRLARCAPGNVRPPRSERRRQVDPDADPGDAAGA